MPTPNETIDNARADYLRAKDQLSLAFADIPDDRIGWSPSPSARTPIEIVAHCALAIRFIQQQMDGTPFHLPTTAEAQVAFRAAERGYRTRAEAVGLLEEVSAQYVAWLEALPPERLTTPAQLPFGLGVMPIEAWLTAPPAHTRGHVAQLEYLQTIYGDEDWRLTR